MSDSPRRCSSCANRLIQKSASGVVFRIEGPVSVDAHGVCHARCYWCKVDVAIPLELSKSFSIEPERITVLTRTTNTRKPSK